MNKGSVGAEEPFAQNACAPAHAATVAGRCVPRQLQMNLSASHISDPGALQCRGESDVMA